MGPGSQGGFEQLWAVRCREPLKRIHFIALVTEPREDLSEAAFVSTALGSSLTVPAS